MKKYFVRYGRFANEYDLAWAETPEQIQMAEDAGYEMVTRKKAESLARDERYRRKNDRAFSGFADAHIFPVDYDSDWGWQNDRRIVEDGVILAYKQ